MIHLLGLATVLLVFHTDVTVSQSVCGTPPPVWRNNNITCPSQAVCADVFTGIRDWRNGTTCESTRVLSNCVCSGNMVCPFDNPDHMVYQSSTHRQFTCEPTCDIDWCASLQSSMSPIHRTSSSRRRTQRVRPVVALTTEQRAREFGGKTYNKLKCRCPRHHFPVVARRSRSRAVKAYGYRWDRTLRRYITQYVCNIGRNDQTRDDPCPPRQ